MKNTKPSHKNPTQKIRGGQEPNKPSLTRERALLSLSLFPSLFLSLSLCLSLSLYLCVSVSLYLCISMSLYLYVSVSLSLSVSVSFCLSVFLSFFLPFLSFPFLCFVLLCFALFCFVLLCFSVLFCSVLFFFILFFLSFSLSLSLFKCIILCLSLCKARSERTFLEHMSERAPHSPTTGQGRQEKDKAQPQNRATKPSHRVDRVQGRGQEEDKAQPQSPTTELTEFRGATKRRTRSWPQILVEGPPRLYLCLGAVEPSWLVISSLSPSHRIDTFRSATKRRTRGRQGPATEPSHRVNRVQGRDQEEDKAQPQSPTTELTEFKGAAKQKTRSNHKAQPEN